MSVDEVGNIVVMFREDGNVIEGRCISELSDDGRAARWKGKRLKYGLDYRHEAGWMV